MADKKQLARLFSMVIEDRTFRRALLRNPLMVAKTIGIDLTPEQAASIKSANTMAILRALDEESVALSMAP